ncbi:MAG: TIGR00730 family Rossman fold protein [Acidimicrobiales bacterium]|nr:TIGR00730 family Rossman fold protein [Acidimicrobiales bacterium]
MDQNSLPRYRTGDAGLDRAVLEIIEEANAPEQPDLLFEMVVSALRMARERVGRGDMKLVNSALKELRYSFHVFAPYREVKKCSIFGSARTKPHEAAYSCAREFGKAMVDQDWMVITGAGPGIMAAGLEGAGTENSFGVNIELPFEAEANEFIVDDHKLINFRYFFTRKLTFMKESHGYALMPGGFGTLDETFELLTLMQTGKTYLAPVVLLDPPGDTYWDTWRDFVVKELLEPGYINGTDLKLVHITDDIPEAVNEICHFYSSYHSMRFVGKRLVLRLNREPSDAELAQLTKEFAPITVSGGVERVTASQSEIDDDDHVDLPRIAFHFDRHGNDKLRLMIDHLNDGGA